MGRERARNGQPILFHDPARAARLTSPFPVGHGHVLVVEDNELVTSAMRALLESAGLRVSSAASIAEAIEVPPPHTRSLVLLDLTLPDGDGLSLVAPLLASGWGNVVALTGHDDSATRDRCLGAGCVDVLLKPVPARELVTRVEGWIGKISPPPR